MSEPTDLDEWELGALLALDKPNGPVSAHKLGKSEADLEALVEHGYATRQEWLDCCEWCGSTETVYEITEAGEELLASIDQH